MVKDLAIYIPGNVDLSTPNEHINPSDASSKLPSAYNLSPQHLQDAAFQQPTKECLWTQESPLDRVPVFPAQLHVPWCASDSWTAESYYPEQFVGVLAREVAVEYYAFPGHL
jgi:hypothetical protein